MHLDVAMDIAGILRVDTGLNCDAERAIVGEERKDKDKEQDKVVNSSMAFMFILIELIFFNLQIIDVYEYDYLPLLPTYKCLSATCIQCVPMTSSET